jgi:hypothetical protein
MGDSAGCYCCRPRVPDHFKIICCSLAAGTVEHVPHGIGTEFAVEPTVTLTDEGPEPPTGEELPQGEMPCVKHLQTGTTNKDPGIQHWCDGLVLVPVGTLSALAFPSHPHVTCLDYRTEMDVTLRSSWLVWDVTYIAAQNAATRKLDRQVEAQHNGRNH